MWLTLPPPLPAKWPWGEAGGRGVPAGDVLSDDEGPAPAAPAAAADAAACLGACRGAGTKGLATRTRDAADREEAQTGRAPTPCSLVASAWQRAPLPPHRQPPSPKHTHTHVCVCVCAHAAAPAPLLLLCAQERAVKLEEGLDLQGAREVGAPDDAPHPALQLVPPPVKQLLQ